MSYARWSSDDWASDVYVYEALDGFVTHVANRRHHFDRSQLPPRVTGSDDDLPRRLIERHQAVMALITDADLVPVDHPEAGATFVHPHPAYCRANLERLRSEGLHVPQFALDALQEVVDAWDG